jgi:hypothetical protein
VTSCDDFHRVDTVTQLLTADDRRPNRVLWHDPSRPIVRSLAPPRRGVQIFGDGQASEVDGWRYDVDPIRTKGPVSTRAAFTFAVDRGVFVPESTMIVSGDDRLVGPSVENFEFWGGIEHREPSVRNVDGQLFWHPGGVDGVAAVAVSVAGVAPHNYGHFLLDGLPLAYLLANSVAGGPGAERLAIVCPILRPWQREILAFLNLERLVHEVERPTRFDVLVGNSFLSQHVTFPTRYARVVFDALKFAVSTMAETPERIFLIRAAQRDRTMRNQDELVQRMVARGYTAIAPEQYSVREQIQMFSRASIVVGATGAGWANVGFAPPGAKLVEIIADCQPDQWIRRLSLLLGHRWHGYIHRVDEIRGMHVGIRWFPRFDFSFDLPLDDFEAALAVIESA